MFQFLKVYFLELQVSTLYVGKNKPFSANKLLVPALNRKVSRGPATVYDLDCKSLAMLTEDGSTDAVPQILYGQYLILGGFGSCMF